MEKQPEALRLADKTSDLIHTLRRTPMPLADLIPHMQATADELRRLHAAVEMLEAENFRRYQENENLKRLASEMFAAEDAYGCGFYNEEAWNKAYNAIRRNI